MCTTPVCCDVFGQCGYQRQDCARAVEVLEPGNRLMCVRLAGMDAPEKESALWPAFLPGALIDGGGACLRMDREGNVCLQELFRFMVDYDPE